MSRLRPNSATNLPRRLWPTRRSGGLSQQRSQQRRRCERSRPWPSNMRRSTPGKWPKACTPIWPNRKLAARGSRSAAPGAIGVRLRRMPAWPRHAGPRPRGPRGLECGWTGRGGEERVRADRPGLNDAGRITPGGISCQWIWRRWDGRWHGWDGRQGRWHGRSRRRQWQSGLQFQQWKRSRRSRLACPLESARPYPVQDTSPAVVERSRVPYYSQEYAAVPAQPTPPPPPQTAQARQDAEQLAMLQQQQSAINARIAQMSENRMGSYVVPNQPAVQRAAADARGGSAVVGGRVGAAGKGHRRGLQNLPGHAQRNMPTRLLPNRPAARSWS